MKAKLNPEMMKEWALNHSEKVIFAIFVCLFFSILWSAAFTLKGIQQRPEELKAAAQRVKVLLDDESRVVEISQVRFDQYATAATKPIDLDQLQTTVIWNPTLFPKWKKREQPEVFAIENLQVVSGRGKLPYSPEERATGGAMDMEPVRRSSTQGLHWNILLGAIPYQKQQEAYDEALGVMMSGTTNVEHEKDTPNYHLYEIQRAELPENWDGDASNLQWKPLVYPQGKMFIDENMKITRTFARGGSSRDASLGINFNSQHVEDEKAYQPPPLKVRPEKQTATTIRRGRGDEQGFQVHSEISLMNPLPPVIAGARQDDTAAMWLRTLVFPEGIDIGKSRQTDSPAMANDGTGVVGVSLHGDSETNSGRTTSDMREVKKPVRLFSYVDYTVEPGKSYVYRVKLQLHNPNFNFRPVDYVAKREYTTPLYLDTRWSEPSTPGTIEQDTSILAAGTEEMQKNNSRPALMLVQFDKETGDELACRFNKIGMWNEDKSRLANLSTAQRREELQRQKDLSLDFKDGRLLNLVADESLMTAMERSSYSSYDRTDGSREYQTGYLLLDIKPGKQVQKLKDADRDPELKNRWDYSAVYTPTRVLLMKMEPDGKTPTLMIQSELEDFQEVFARDKDRQHSPVDETPSETPKSRSPRSGGSLLGRP